MNRPIVLGPRADVCTSVACVTGDAGAAHTFAGDRALPGGWYHRHVQGQVQIANLCAGGCFAESPDPSPPAGPIRLQVGLPRTGQLWLSAEVVYTRQGRGFGLRFLGLTDEDRAALTDAVAYLRD